MVEIETEEQKTRADISACLRVLADQFERDGAVRLVLGGETVTFDPADTLIVRLETESDWCPSSGRTYRRVGFDLEWVQPADEQGISVSTGTPQPSLRSDESPRQ
ncbi:amphi-Trp domain-containing protein [Haloarchaeobius sp. TZWWS8]|uniref:amphi-Trp domain-containing protein n=1 Tax=Haloarchaeobius sp. TZWWS8 TaxID=3446121 RepID=UPI003EBC4C71